MEQGKFGLDVLFSITPEPYLYTVLQTEAFKKKNPLWQVIFLWQLFSPDPQNLALSSAV